MAPGITSEVPNRSLDGLNGHGNVKAAYQEPLQLSGALDKFLHEDTTPVIGREYFSINIVDDLLNARDADELLRDLAITSTSKLLFLQNYSYTAQFLNAASYFFVLKTISQMIYKSNLSTVLDSSAANPPTQRCISIQC
jgi:hypothetical protein